MPNIASSKSVCFITGCASGIGRSLATTLAQRGHPLFVTDHNSDALTSAADALSWRAPQVVCARLDVRDPAAWEAALDEAWRVFGRVDVLLNVAGVVLPGHAHEQPTSAVDFHLDTNAKGTIFGTQLAAARMVRQGSGHIVNIASMAALAPVPGLALYSASKFAVRGFSLAVARELRPLNVAVSVVCPDAVATPMVDLQLDYPEAALTFSGPRILLPEEVTAAIVDRVLPRRPLEIVLPRSRGWLAKLSSLAPGLIAPLFPRLEKIGLRKQSQVRKQRHAASSR